MATSELQGIDESAATVKTNVTGKVTLPYNVRSRACFSNDAACEKNPELVRVERPTPVTTVRPVKKVKNVERVLGQLCIHYPLGCQRWDMTVG